LSIDRPSIPEDPSQARPYNREYHLKQFWFDLFALDEYGIFLPYEDMLLYMASVAPSLRGLYRVVAIGERTPMPTSQNNERMSPCIVDLFKSKNTND
jgi:hypothetical protein